MHLGCIRPLGTAKAPGRQNLAGFNQHAQRQRVTLKLRYALQAFFQPGLDSIDSPPPPSARARSSPQAHLDSE